MKRLSLLVLAMVFILTGVVLADDNDWFKPQTKLNPAGQLGSVTVPAPANYARYRQRQPLTEIPEYNTDSESSWQVDLRSRDVSKLNMNGKLYALLHAEFDGRTIWPSILPNGFNPQRVMKDGSNPGLSVRTLQAKGITGKGVGIAIIDQVLLTTHQEYQDRIKSYEMIHCYPEGDGVSSMHGPAVASIALGKTVGVAPEANLYYIAATFGDYSLNENGDIDKFDYDCGVLAQSIERVLEINKMPQVNGEIRVISVSWGPWKDLKNYDQYLQAINHARKDNILVITTSMAEVYSGIGFMGMERQVYHSADNIDSYSPAYWVQKDFYENPKNEWWTSKIWLPMSSRTTASPTGSADYVFYSSGGLSWSAPYLAGLYALACQSNPKVTPEQFLKTAMQTGDYTTISHDGSQYRFGPIANPQKLIDVLR